MKRREFIRRTVPVSVLPLFLSGYTVKAYGRSPILETLLASATETDRVLVLIQLNGGNDGLNMVIPLDQYSAYSNARANIAIPEDKVLKLTDTTGLHPSMTGLQSLYFHGGLCIVQGVGYPNPNFSHFRATDIWLSASDSDQTLASGWMGRYLDQEFADFPNGYPNAVMPDPLAIQIGSVVSTGLQGPSVSMGMALTSPTSFYQLVTGGTDVAPNTPAGHELTFLRLVAQQTQQYAGSIQTAAGKGHNVSTMYPSPGANSLADQLKIVAQLIAGGLKTRMYVVNIGGFDTHSSQVDTTGGNETGTHANLLGKLSAAISAFEDDLTIQGLHNRVIGMTFSEFGRRIISNASSGTDHGAGAPMIIFGKKVFHNIIGHNPIIPPNATVSDNVPMQYDFRSVYASVLKDWFGVPAAELQAVLLKDFTTLPIIPTPPTRTKPDPFVRVVDQAGLGQNFPNPFNPATQISFVSDGGHVQITVYDEIGREIKTLVDGTYPAGIRQVTFDGSGLPSGMYYYRMRNGSFEEVKTMILAK